VFHADTVLSIAANACSSDTINPSNHPDLSTDSIRITVRLTPSSIAEGEHPMTGASKILTVSYGTFSCTLEGFDDPFNTMKAIAEYFRDLAAGDRYFGAEPPTPDAAMLHRIAEREIQRRVEAKIQDNGVILRAGDAAEALTTEPVARAPLLDALAPLPEAGTESVAARLQRIRARHAQAAPIAAATQAIMPDAPVIPQKTLVDEAYTEDQHADEFSASVQGAMLNSGRAAPQIEPFDQADVMGGFADATFDVPEALIADRLLPDADAPLVTAADVHPADHAAIMIEDDDQDFEASAEINYAMLAGLTSEQPDAVAAEPASDLPEDQHSAEAEPVALMSGTDPVDLPEEIAAHVVTGAAEFDDTALLSRLNVVEDVIAATGDDLPEADKETADAQSVAIWAALGTATGPLPAETADFDDAEDLTLEALPDTPRETDLAVEAAEAPMMIEIDQTAPDEVTDDSADPAPTLPTEPAHPLAEAAPRARARVIRIRRAAPPEAETDTPDAELAVETPVQPATTGILSDEAEAALQAELAALEAELGGTLTDAEPEVTRDVAPEPAAAAIASDPTAEPRPINVPAEDEAVSRLMAQAATEMGGEETRRRQSAIAHLKAAVAATEADRAVTGGRSAQGEQRMEPYRDDLERVVRPRRPQAEVTTPRPPAVPDPAARPTPLVLVSAQRIDQPRPAAPHPSITDSTAPRVVIPVRTRRPALAQPSAALASAPQAMMQDTDQVGLDDEDALTPEEAENLFSDATSFQDFADQLGAEALPDLLEAAAVYCAEVLQRPEFSRPLVMRQIAALPGQSQTAREDYLRSFGTLLRQGRITKVKRGMFALTDRSPYLAEARKLAG
jgi:hypothetical protein